MPDIVQDTIRDVVDIKTEGTADNGHDLPPSEKLFRNGDTKMRNSKHFAVMKRSKTGTIVRHPMRSDELQLIYEHPDMMRGLLEVEYPGFQVEYYEEVGEKNGSDS